ncbi:uncharacterized protein LOC132733281 [Ruditapes philippinarum]|uniref:uncharacterized protein LOC132733281 n=1 Tax=Ruditapes philippinarum TaxID=129788 RepID=UPI00295BACBE|nr:uncharacterized protein LOC132733281 [Ruditapes philippinarum]
MAFPPLQPLPEINVWDKKKDKTAYLHKPPTIQPNYGQKGKRSLLPKTNISRVLLYENTMQDNVLDVQVKYLTKQKRNFRFTHRKLRYAFIDTLNHRRKWHEVWDASYQRMKDAFIAKYGTRYMPVPTPEPEIDPFTIYARLAPPINVLCFYLDSQQGLNQLKKEKQKETHKSLMAPHKTSESEYLQDHERLVNNRDYEPMLYTRSTEDPRFRRLEECLAPPTFNTDGYSQLSPGFCKADAKVKKWAVRHRGIVLPKFYTRHLVASRESTKIPSGRVSVEKDTTFPIIDDDRSSLSELSTKELTNENTKEQITKYTDEQVIEHTKEQTQEQ